MKQQGFESCVLLINPTRYPQYVKFLKRMLKRTEIPVVIESTSKQHFLDSVADFYDSRYQYLLVWGGDGTAHDAINALIKVSLYNGEKKSKSIGFLRGGSGNGIQDSYEVPNFLAHQLNTYAESMSSNYTIEVDLLKLRQNQQIFYGQLIGLGFDTEVLKLRDAQKMIRQGNIKSGLLNYAVSAISTFITRDLEKEAFYSLDLRHGKYALRGTRTNAEYPFENLQLKVNPPMIEIGTRPYYGKMFKVCPDVVCNDGCMDLYLFNFEDKMAVARHFISLWNGWHHKINKRFARKNKPLIQRFELKQLEIHSEKPFDFHIDGEFKKNDLAENGRYSLFVEIVPQAISFIVPKTFYIKFHPFDLE